MRLYYLLVCAAGLMMYGCNGQQTGRLEQREAHYEVHVRMERDLQELMRRHSNLRHEHEQWVAENRDTVPNVALQEMEQRHAALKARHEEIRAEHHRLMEEHHAFFETRDDLDIPKNEWRARYKEVEGDHERMEDEHKQMKKEQEQMHAEHRQFKEQKSTTAN